MLLCANEPHRSTPPGSQKEDFCANLHFGRQSPSQIAAASSRGGAAQLSLLHFSIWGYSFASRGSGQTARREASGITQLRGAETRVAPSCCSVILLSLHPLGHSVSWTLIWWLYNVGCVVDFALTGSQAYGA